MKPEIKYTNSPENITPEMLTGFFVGWPNPPSVETHLKILQQSSHCVLALEDNIVVGFINAISDNVISAYIPLLEVMPNYQNQGIGKELVSRMKNKLKDIYMIDLTCDLELQSFYKKFGFTKSTGMMVRNYEHLLGS